MGLGLAAIFSNRNSFKNVDHECFEGWLVCLDSAMENGDISMLLIFFNNFILNLRRIVGWFFLMGLCFFCLSLCMCLCVCVFVFLRWCWKIGVYRGLVPFANASKKGEKWCVMSPCKLTPIKNEKGNCIIVSCLVSFWPPLLFSSPPPFMKGRWMMRKSTVLSLPPHSPS